MDEFHRALVADSRRSGNVVDRVAAQRHHVDDFRRRHPEKLLHLRGVADQIVFGRVEHADVVVHQLQHVFVARHDEHRIRFRGRFSRQRSDHVVGFIAFELQNWDAISFERAPNVRNLLHQIAWHLGAIGFVSAIFGFFEGLRLDVELADGGDRFRLLIADGRRAHVEHSRQIFAAKNRPAACAAC